MPWSDGGARRDANLLRIESFGMGTIARVAFLPAPGVGPQSFANPAIGPERRTVDFPDHTASDRTYKNYQRFFGSSVSKTRLYRDGLTSEVIELITGG